MSTHTYILYWSLYMNILIELTLTLKTSDQSICGCDDLWSKLSILVLIHLYLSSRISCIIIYCLNTLLDNVYADYRDDPLNDLTSWRSLIICCYHRTTVVLIEQRKDTDLTGVTSWWKKRCGCPRLPKRRREDIDINPY